MHTRVFAEWVCLRHRVGDRGHMLDVKMPEAINTGAVSVNVVGMLEGRENSIFR